MRWQRFMNWCRVSVGLARKPVAYRMNADFMRFSATLGGQ